MNRQRLKTISNRNFCAMIFLIFILYIVDLCYGAEGAYFLLITPGARAIGLGQSFVAIADDATACYYNPAGLAFVSQPQVLSMNLSPPPGIAKAILWGLTEISHPLFSQKVHSPVDPPGDDYHYRYFYTAAVFPSFSRQIIGIDINYYKTYSVMEMDEISIYEYYPSYSFGIDYGNRIFNNFGVGISMKYICERVPYWDITSRSFALGGGILFKSPRGFSFGVSLSNLGPPMKYIETAAVLPLTVRVGLAQSVPDFFVSMWGGKHEFTEKLHQYFSLQFTIERRFDLAGETHYHKTSCGFEVKVFDMLSYRQGFSLTEDQSSKWSNPKGIGIDLKIAEFDITITNSNYYAGWWWIQSKFKPMDNKPEFLRQNKVLDRIFLNLSCLAIPGGGQLYNGNKWLALPYLVASFFVADVILESHTKPSWQDEAYNTVVMTLPVLYLLSGLEANISLGKSDGR